MFIDWKIVSDAERGKCVVSDLQADKQEIDS